MRMEDGSAKQEYDCTKMRWEMLQEIFQTVWELATRGTLLMGCVLLARFFLKKMPRNLTCLLWAVLALRLLMPWNIPVTLPDGQSTGLVSAGAEAVENPADQLSLVIDSQQGIGDNLQVGADSMEKAGAVRRAVRSAGQSMEGWRETFWRICPFLWAGGAAAVCTYWIVMDLRLRGRVREAVLVKKNRQKVRVMECDRIETAFVLGLFRPAIYLPDSLENPDRKYVLLHEKAHLCRKDHIWKWTACLLLCIYWFHPLMWICASAFSGDVEEACDEAVLKKLGAKGKLPYAKAIFQEADVKRTGWAGAPGFGEGNMKKRVKHVLDYQKKAAAGVILAAAVILGACSPFFMERKAVEAENVPVAEKGDLSESEGQTEEAVSAGQPEETAQTVEEQNADGDANASGTDSRAQKDWTIQPVKQEELSDPLMAADGHLAMLRKNEGSAEKTEISYRMPVQEGRIANTYCIRQHPVTQEKRLHSGVDFAAEAGSAVLAAAPGTVVETGFESYCGNYVIIRHANGDLTYYAQCAEILTEKGAVVEAGEQIANMGSTGMSTGYHLHFALSRDGVFIDPFAEPGEFSEAQSETVDRDKRMEAELAEPEKNAPDSATK